MTLPEAPRLQITGRTGLMFIIGDPIAHVVGTAVLNVAWARLGRDLVTVPLQVAPADLPHALDLLRRAPNVAGTGITIPHKIAAAGLVDRLTEAAAHAGAVNFVRRNPDGTLTGHNIDGAGFLAGLADHGVELAGRRVVLAGAGGVARAIAFAVAGAGARSLTLRNRDRAKAEALAAEIRGWSGAAGCAVAAGDETGAADLLINGTALGMEEGDALPFAPDEIPAGAVAAEVVMSPPVTAFLAAARAKGCPTVPGRAMLDPQAQLVAAFLDGDPA